MTQIALHPDINGTSSLYFMLGDPNAGVTPGDTRSTNFAASGATVNVTVNPGDVNVGVSSVTPFHLNTFIQIDNEFMFITGIGGSTLSVRRGSYNSVIATHAVGAAVLINIVAIINNANGIVQFLESTLQYPVPVQLASPIISGWTDVVGAIRSTGVGTLPVTGIGVEIYESGGQGTIQAFNRGTSAFAPLQVEGSLLGLNDTTNGPINTGTGLFTAGGLFQATGINSTPIGATTPAAITGTNITANTKFIGSVIAPPSDGIHALDITNAAASISLMLFDTINFRVGINQFTPLHTLDLNGDLGIGSAGQLTVNSSGKVTKYNADTTAGNGLASNVARVALTGQTAQILSTTTGFTPPADGEYLVTLYFELTTVGTGGTITAGAGRTDDNGAQTNSFPATITTSKFFQVLTQTIHARTTASINYFVTFSGVTGTPAYSLFVNVLRIS